MEFAVHTDGLRDFRRDLRRFDPALDRELRDELTDAIGKVNAQAALLAPRGTQPIPVSRRPRLRLYQSFRPFVTLRGAGIRSALPYAPVIEYTKLSQRSAPVTRAIEREADTIVDSYGDAVMDAARRAGWQ